MKTPNKCPACGEGTLKSRSQKGRRTSYRGVDVELPTLFLTDCSTCGEVWLDDAESAFYSKAVEAAFNVELCRRACAALTAIEPVATQRHLERLLHLSHGYLSKVRNEAKVPSATLVGQLALLAVDPKTRVAELERFWSSGARVGVGSPG